MNYIMGYLDMGENEGFDFSSLKYMPISYKESPLGFVTGVTENRYLSVLLWKEKMSLITDSENRPLRLELCDEWKGVDDLFGEMDDDGEEL